MTNFARIINSVAVDVSSAPAKQFHPSIAAEFVEVPATVVPGSRLVDGEWVAPGVVEAPASPEVGNMAPTSPEFMLLFTLAERVAIRSARPTDPVVDDILQMVEDPRLTFVELASASVIEAVQYLTLGDSPLVAPERAARILQGLPPLPAT
ncbi:hypothetical protein IEG05_19690 [Pseudomonas kunmingensis]|uniref:hypothetical protein n=1 Tax=Stutzerimonas kunmingensis TaxID=1211807 RepID=UPI0017464DD8|nr:hypothetical protein [Stutzerimonas kunmingensis]MBD3877431.1 hypothetical protein [Stutzerimonas kunmingensis]